MPDHPAQTPAPAGLLDDAAFLRSVIAASPDCIKVLDLDARLTFVSENGRRALEIDDLTPHLGTCWTDWWHGADHDLAAAAVAEARAGRTGRFEAGAVTAKGTARWWDVTVTAIPGPDGRPARLLSVSRDITARRAARDLAAERLNRLRSVVESARDYAVISIDRGGTIDGWSGGAADAFGWTEAEAVGQSFDLIWTAEDRTAGSPGNELLTAEQVGMCPDARWHVRADGRRIFVAGACRPVHNAAGELTGFVKVCRDQTDDHGTAEALADARRRLDAALIGGRVATWVWEVGADRLFGDRNLFVMFNLPDDGGGGLPVAAYADTLHPDDRPAVMAALDRAVRTGEDYVAEYRIVTTDPPRWAYARARVEPDADGRPARLAGMVADVTGRKAAEAELAFERHQLELIFRESPAAMALWRGEDAVFERVNPGYQDLFPGRPLAGLPVLDALPELRGQGFDDLIRRVLHAGEPFVGREVLARLARTADGPVEDRYFDFSFLQVRDPDGRPWGVYDHAVEVTDRVLARQALERSEAQLRAALVEREDLLASERAARAEAEQAGRMKDEFLATLSHELRTPLNAIVGWTQILKMDRGLSEDVAEGLTVIDRNARAQTQIIEDILDMSRIVSGKVRLDVQRVDLAAAVRAGADTVRPAADAKGVQLRVVIDPLAASVNGDPGRLHQVFWNLLSNAVKFTPKGGRVQVVLERVNSHVEASVVDTGEGIDPAFLPFVFDRFRQADASTTRRHGGLGLGLSIVKQLVELHGGAVRVKSPGKGHGATFVVALPLAVVHPEASEPDAAREHPHAEVSVGDYRTACDQLSGVRAVVVDDEPDGREVVRRLLADCGAVVRTAGSAAQAMLLLAESVPDVLVTDIGMPVEDGYGLIRRVRSLPPAMGGRVPAVALTAYARAADRIKAMDAGFQMHLSKPVEPAELVATVASLARQARQASS